MHAVIGGHVEVVKALLRGRADVNIQDKVSGHCMMLLLQYQCQ